MFFCSARALFLFLFFLYFTLQCNAEKILWNVLLLCVFIYKSNTAHTDGCVVFAQLTGKADELKATQTEYERAKVRFLFSVCVLLFSPLCAVFYLWTCACYSGGSSEWWSYCPISSAWCAHEGA